MRVRAAAAGAIAALATACYPGITVTGPVTEIGGGRICVRADHEVPGGGCAEYPPEADVAGIAVGDCVTMRLYEESARFRDVEEIPCPAGLSGPGNAGG